MFENLPMKYSEILKYTGKLHLTLQTTIKNDEILKYTGKLHLPLQTMLVNLRKSPELSDSIEICPTKNIDL